MEFRMFAAHTNHTFLVMYRRRLYIARSKNIFFRVCLKLCFYSNESHMCARCCIHTHHRVHIYEIYPRDLFIEYDDGFFFFLSSRRSNMRDYYY